MFRQSALGRFLPVVTLRDFSSTATCYAESNGRGRPEGDVRVRIWRPMLFSNQPLNENEFPGLPSFEARVVV